MFRGTQYFSQFGCTDHFPPHLHHYLFNRLHDDGQPPPSSCPRGRLCPYSHDDAMALLAASKGVATEELPQAAPTTTPAPAPLAPAPAPAPVPSAYPLPSQQPLGPPPLAPPPGGSSVDLARVLAQALAGAGGLPLPYQSLGAAPPQPLPPSSSSSSYSSAPPQQQPPSSSSAAPVGGYQARPPQPSAPAPAGAYNPHASLVATLTAMSARLSSAAPPAPMDVSAASYEQQPTASAPSVKKPLLLGRRREGLRGLSALRGTGAKSSLPSMSLALPKKKPASRPEPKNLVSAKPSASEGGPQRAAQGPTTGPKQAARAPPQAGDKRKLEAPARPAPPSAQPHPRSRTAAQSLVASTAAMSPPAGSVKRARVEPIAPMDEYDPLLPMGSFDSPLNLSGSGDDDDDDDEDDDDVLLLEAKAKKAAAAPPPRQLLKRVPATTTATKGIMTSSARPAGAPGAQRVTVSAGQSRPTAAAAGQIPGFFRKRPAEPDDAPTERALEVKGAQLQLAVEKHKRMMAQRAGQGSGTAHASSSTGSHPPRPSGSQLYAPVLPSTLAGAGAGASSLSVAPSSLPYAFSTSSTASSSFAPAYASSSSSSLAPTLPTSTSAIARPSVNRSALSSSSGSTRLAKLRKDMPVLVRPAAARTPSATATTTTAATSAASLAPAPGQQQQRQRQPTAADKQRAMLDQRRKHLEDKQRQRDEAEKRRHQSAAHAARQAASLGLGPAHSASAVAGAPQQQQQQQVAVMGGGGGVEEEEDDMEEVEYRELQGKPRDIVPAPRYPTVAFDLKPKVPRAVRQAVLDKFLEETLRKHHFLHFALDSCAGQPDDAWMQTAIDEAVRLETEQYQKCQSKGVYVNLCAKAMQVLKRGE